MISQSPREKSTWATHGVFAKCSVPISFFAHMENAVATSKKKKRSCGATQEKGVLCEVATATRKMAENCWPSKDVEETIQTAMRNIEKQCQPTLFHFYAKAASSSSSAATPRRATSSLDHNQNKRKTAPKTPEVSRKKKGVASNILKLAESLNLENVDSLAAGFAAGGEEDLVARGIGQLLLATDQEGERILSAAKGKGWKNSKFKKARAKKERLQEEVKSRIVEIDKLLQPDDIPGESVLERYGRMAPRIQRSNELKAELKDLLPDFREAVAAWKRALQVRKPMVEVEAEKLENSMDVLNYSQPWWKAMDTLNEKF